MSTISELAAQYNYYLVLLLYLTVGIDIQFDGVFNTCRIVVCSVYRDMCIDSAPPTELP